MGRPAKAGGARSRHETAEEKAKRTRIENGLRGETGRLRAPRYLSAAQRKIFAALVGELEAADILGGLDVYILATAAVAIDRLRAIEQTINEDVSRVCDKDLMAAKDKYAKDFFRCCTELCLSPQSRAKISAAAVKKDEPNPLADALRDD